MISKRIFLLNELPYNKLALIGLDKPNLLNLPKEMLDPLLNGAVTPLFKAELKKSSGEIITLPMKMQLTKNDAGEVIPIIYPVRHKIYNDCDLKKNELEKLQDGKVIRKEFIEAGERTHKYLQLDKETNAIIIKNATDIKLKDRMAEVEKINDIQLGAEQKQRILEGKAVELDVGADKKVTVGVDLKSSNGFKITNGDLNEWKKQEAIKYDLAHPEFMGFVKTDQNRWEYQQIMKEGEKTNYKKEEKITNSTHLHI